MNVLFYGESQVGPSLCQNRPINQHPSIQVATRARRNVLFSLVLPSSLSLPLPSVSRRLLWVTESSSGLDLAWLKGLRAAVL